jgi:NADH-quinone oxidoreductase subunit N
VPIFAFLSIATMTVGNFVALQQTQIVRLLAYSGIAQSGYILMTFALVTDDATSNRDAFAAGVAYILIYGIMNLGAFAATVAVSRRHPALQVADFAGLRETAPIIAVGMAVFMISLAGVPPTGGFWGKLLIFQAAIERGGTLGPALAVVMLVNSVVSVFYYLVVPRQMFLRDAADRSRLRVPGLVTAVVVLAMVAILAIFVVPNAVARLAEISTLVGLGP